MLALLLSAALLQTTSPPIGQRSGDPGQLLGRLDFGSEEADIAAASAFPLGSLQNPVRVGGPDGARNYVGRLRCADGAVPQLGAPGSGGVGAFGSETVSYQLTCPAGASTVQLDIYHEEHREERAPAGLTIVGNAAS